MNKFIKYYFLLMMGAFDVYHGGAIAQSVTYYPPLDFIPSNMSLRLIGQFDERFAFYRQLADGKAELLFCHQNGEVVTSQELNFIKVGVTSNVNIVATSKQIHFICQNIQENKHYLVFATLDEKGKIKQPANTLDSTRLDLFHSKAFYTITSSENKKFILCYRIIGGFSENQLYFNGILLDENGKQVGNTIFYIPFNAEMETTGVPYVTNGGQCFLAVYDKVGNFKLGTTLRLFQTSVQNNTPSITEIYFKENKPSEFLLDWWEEKQIIVAGGLYSNFYSKNVEGSYAAFIKPGSQKAERVLFHPMEKKFKKELRNGIYGISMNDVVNTLQTRYFKVYPDGKTILLTDLFTNFTLSRSSLNNTFSGTSIYKNPAGYTTTTTQSPSGANLPPTTTTTRSITQDRASSGNAANSFRNRQATAPPITPPAIPGNSEKVPKVADNGIIYPVPITPKDAGDALILNKTMDYKSVFFYDDPARLQQSNYWVRNLYIPGTPFTNVLILPSNDGQLKLLNYEVNKKNIPYLNSVQFQLTAEATSQKVDIPGHPFLFYKKNIVWWDNNCILTLYENSDTGQVGVAKITW